MSAGVKVFQVSLSDADDSCCSADGQTGAALKHSNTPANREEEDRQLANMETMKA